MPPTIVKNPIAEIARIDKLLDLNRLLLTDPGEVTINKIKERINTLLDERTGWMAKRDVRKPKKGVVIPTNQDL